MENIEDIDFGIERTETKVVRILGIKMRIHKPVFPKKSRWTARNIVLIESVVFYVITFVGVVSLISNLYVSVYTTIAQPGFWIVVEQYVASIFYVIVGVYGVTYTSESYAFNFKDGDQK